MVQLNWHICWRSFLSMLLVFSIQFGAFSAFAADEINLKKVAEAEKRSEAIAEAQGGLILTRDGETPLSTLIAISQAVEQDDWQTAAEFVDLRYLPKALTPRMALNYCVNCRFFGINKTSLTCHKSVTNLQAT